MPTVDNKIVQMTFENKQFERGVKDSLQSLEQLKQALDLDKSAQSLLNLEKIASNFDISHIADSIDKISDRFTLFGNVGQEVFRRISKTAVDTMQNIVNTVTGMPKEGMGKYEQRNKAVQMIQSAMPEKSLSEIESALDKLNEYTDLTSYDFSQMAQSIGKFTSAGIDLDVAERAMEGIANEAASAGGEIAQANIAMYNFSQALGQGAVLKMDWNSIVQQNLATKEFREEIIKTAIELGTLQKVGEKTGKTAKGDLVNFKTMDQTLSQRWFTSDVLIKVLEKYADRESEVGKKGFEAAKIAITFTQAIDAVKDAISTSWMKSFQYIFGNLEEAGKLFTRISDALIDFTDRIGSFRNSILEGWHTGGEDGISGYELAIESLSNTWKSLMGVVEAARGAFENVFGTIDSSGLINMTQTIKDFTDKVKDFFGYSEETVTKYNRVWKVTDGIEEWSNFLQKGVRGDEVKTLQERLLSLGNDMIRLDKYGADGIFGPETQKALKAFQESVGIAPTGIYDKQTRDALAKSMFPDGVKVAVDEEYTEIITHMGSGLEHLREAFQGVFAAARIFGSLVKAGLKITENVIKMFSPLVSVLGRVASIFGGMTTNLSTTLEDGKAFENVVRKITTFLTPLGNVIENVSKWLNNFLDGYIKFTKATVPKSFTNLFDALNESDTSRVSFASFFEYVLKMLKKNKALSGIVDLITTIQTVVKDFATSISSFFKNLSEKAKEGNYLEKLLNGISVALQVILAIIGGVGYGLFAFVKAVIDGAKALFEFARNSETVQNILSAVKSFLSPVKDFFVSVWNSIKGIVGQFGKFKSFAEIWKSFITQMAEDAVGQKFVPALKKIKSAISAPIKKIREFGDSIGIAFKALRDYKDTDTALTELMKDPEKNQGAINVISFLKKIQELIGKIKPIVNSVKQSIGTVFGKMAPAIKEFGTAVWDSIKNFFSGNGSSATEKITSRFESIKAALQSALDKVSGWVSDIVERSPFLTEIVNFGKMIGEAVKNFFSMDTSDTENAADKIMKRLKAFDPTIEWIKEKIDYIKGVFAGEGSLIAKIKKFFSSEGLLGNIGDGAKNIGDALSGIDLGAIWDTAKMAFGAYILATIVRTISRFSKTLSSLVNAKTNKGNFAKSVLEMAVAVGIIAGAIALLANIDAKRALAGVGVMSAALGAMVTSMILLNVFAKDSKNIGIGILAIAAGIGLVVLALWGASKLIENTDPGLMRDSFLLVGGILAILSGVAFVISKFGKAGGSVGGAALVLALCVGIGLVVRAIGKVVTLMKKNVKNPGIVWEAFGMVEAIMASLGAIAFLISRFGKTGGSFAGALMVLSICLTIGSVVRAIGNVTKLIKKFGSDAVWQAFGMVEIVLATIGATAVLISATGNGVNALNLVASIAPILAMGHVITEVADAFAEGIVAIKDVDPEIVKSFLTGVDVAIGILAAAIGAFSMIPVTGFLSASVGFVAVLTALGAGLDIAATFTADAMKKLSSALWLVGSRMADFSGFMEKVDTSTISIVMESLTSTILPAIAEMTAYSSYITDAIDVGKNIWRFGNSIKLFNKAISGVSVESGQGILQLSSDINEVVTEINSIQGIDDAKDVLSNLGGALALYYGDLRKAMTDTPDNTDTENFDINKANEAFSNLAELTLDDDTLKKISGFATGGENDLNNFAIGIENLGTALKDYGDSIGDLDADKVDTANSVLDKVSDIQSSLNSVGSFDQLFGILSGKRETIEDFGLDISALGGALADYATSIADLDENKIKMANSVMSAVSRLNRILPKTGGLWSMLAGEKSLGDFAVNMSDLGSGMAEYATKVSDASFTNVDASIAPIQALAAVQNTLQESGGLASLITGTQNLGDLGNGLADLGDDLKAFADSGIKSLKDSDFAQMEKAIGPISVLAEAQSKIKVQGGLAKLISGAKDLGQLGQGLVTFGDHLLTFQGKMAGFVSDDEHVLAALSVLERVVGFQDTIQGTDKDMDRLNKLGTSFQQFFENLASVVEVNNDSSLASDAQDAVYMLLDDIADAIATDSNAPESMATLLTNVIGKINDYSDDFTLAGENLNSCFSIGFYNPGASGTTNGITEGLQGYKNAIENGIDDSIVITPVLDLSQVASGADKIGGMIGKQTIGSGLNLANGIAGGKGTVLVQSGNDSSVEIASAITNLNNKMTEVVGEIAKLKVYMDTGALVGQLAGPMDRKLGQMASQNARRGG